MPAISVDTFFACSLMVLLVLSAMATTSKLLYPHINNMVDDKIAEKYAEFSRYLLLSYGSPYNWGENFETIPETFGLADADSNIPYSLDIDKVSRLNSENLYHVSYAEIFAILKMPDVSFNIEIKPIFEVNINLTAIFAGENETVYQFEIITEKHGVLVQSELKYYVIAENYLAASGIHVSEGRKNINITLANSVNGPALLAVFAKAASYSKIASFKAYPFKHNSVAPKPKGTFLNFSPLNYTLRASFLYSEINLSNVYALTYCYNSTLMQISSINHSAMYAIPHFLDSSPILLVGTGWNSTDFFIEWSWYPQVPVQIGPNFESVTALSNVFTYTYAVTINSVFYECTLRVGGPRE